MSSQAILRIKDLYVNFKSDRGLVKVLDGLCLTIKAGEILALIGETGCGKSVAAKAILRLLPKTAQIQGEILYKGRNLLSLSEREMRKVRGGDIGMIFQDPLTSLNPVFTVGTQMTEMFRVHKLKRRGQVKGSAAQDPPMEELAEQETVVKDTAVRDTAARGASAIDAVVELLNLVQIPDAEKRAASYPFQLSGGMRQRVMTAMMLSARPSLLIADEPTTALDVTIQAQILKLLAELREELNTSILLITHDSGVVAELVDRVLVMYAGQIIEVASVQEIFAHPRHPYTRGLMKAMPLGHKNERELANIPGRVPNLIHPPSGCRFHPRCSRAMDLCKMRKPKLLETADRHFVACYAVNGHSQEDSENDA